MNSPSPVYYPLFLNLNGRRAVVIGGGKVAERKIGALIDAGAKVTVVSPAFTKTIADWIHKKTLTGIARPYRPGDLEKAVLAFAATDAPQVNRAVVQEARQRKIFVNVADRSASGDFIVPAAASTKDFSVAVSSHGKSPALAIAVRDRIRQFLAEAPAAREKDA